MKDFNNSVKKYKQELNEGSLQEAYIGLIKFMMSLGTQFSKKIAKEYSFGSLFQGYMDYTYFYYTNDFLRKNKLKMAMVLNHKEMSFEIWLLGQTKPVQEKFWQLFKSTKWCKGVTEKPQYSVFAVIIDSKPDFSNLERLSKKLAVELIKTSKEIINAVDNVS